MIRLTPGTPEETVRGYTRWSLRFEAERPLDDLWFLAPAHSRPLSEDWLVPAGLMAGMALGQDVHIAGRVSERLVGSMDAIQRVLVARQERLVPVRITADAVEPGARAAKPRTVSCFSAGVDAFHTALAADVGIDEHLYIHGLEERLSDHRLLPVVLPRLRSAATRLGRPLRVGESNWRDVIEPLAGNQLFVLAGHIFTFAYLMASDVTRLVVPGTCDPSFAPDEPLSVRSFVEAWTTESVETIEHGHIPRFDKVRGLIDSDIAMRHLRVCWSKNQTRYNCGHCIKCIRTRVHLKLAGAEGRCTTLPPRLDPEDVRQAQPETARHRNYVDENIALAEQQGLADLADALRMQRDAAPDRPMRRTARARARRWLRRVAESGRRRWFDLAWSLRRRRHPGEHPLQFLE